MSIRPAAGPHEQVVAFLEEAVRAAGGQGFKLAEVAFSTTMLALDTTVRRILGQVLSDLCEVVHLYDCDYLLISGRPCRLPAVRAAILAKLPAPPDRIVSLHTYRVGDWYPFRSVSGRLTDPKTTAAVGAMVCALSEGQLYKFNLRSRELGMKSTARFIGVLEQTGRLKKENVLFANLELEDRKTRLPEATFDFYAPVFLGFRQLARGTLAGHAAVSRHLRPSAGRADQGAAAQGHAGTLHRRERRSGFQGHRRGRRRRQPAAGWGGAAEVADPEGRIRLLAGYRHLLDFRPVEVLESCVPVTRLTSNT
ncbi:MAG: virulence factor SrfB [Chromatiales bacterium]|nr:virulence factor SrfB [Chromatiales bacterium]